MAFDVDKTTNLTSDVYGIHSYVDNIKKNFTPDVPESTLVLGIFGYMGEMFATQLQNDIVMASEFSNESIATKAKFEKNVIAHALGVGLTDINARPAQLDVLLTFIEDDIIEWANARDADGNDLPWEFIFDKDTPIYIGDYEFHVYYDIKIRKILLENAGVENKFAYSARYIMDIDNPISDITNPYLTPPVKMNVNGMNVIFTKCTLRQVKLHTIYKKVLSDNSISAKTTTFDFEGQLAAFTIDVTEGSNVTHMVPVYDGISTEVQRYPYFYYTYLDADTIRIKFDRYSYQPRINSEVKINLYTTDGEAGNFTFDPDVYPGYAFESEKYEYSNIGCEIRPITGESAYGTDKKSVEDLKKLIPKEALSRGSITNLADLENYFNMLNTDVSKLYFYKKRDNALERLYYSFMVMKDNYNVIIPTNTIDIMVTADQLQTEEGSGKLVFKKGQVIRLIDDVGYIYTPEDGEMLDYDGSFYYTIPYSFIINTYPLYGMYYLSTMDANKFLDFTYINENCLYQFIATYINFYRGYLNDPNTYEMSITLEQNIIDEISMIGYDEEGNVINTNLRVVAVFYNDEDKEYRWAEASFNGAEPSANLFSFKFRFTTEDYIDTKNRIRIDTGMYDIGTDTESYGHFDANTKCIIHILSKQGGNTDLNGLDKIIPGLDGYVVSNSYTVVDGIDFFYDYSEIIESVITVEKEEEEVEEGETTEDTGAMTMFTMRRSTTAPIIGETDEVVPGDDYVDPDIEVSEEQNNGDSVDFTDDELEVDDSLENDSSNSGIDPGSGKPIDPDTGNAETDPEEEVPEGPKEWFRIKSVPVVKADYFDSEDKVIEFAKELVTRKNYIDYAVQVLEDAFGMDFKFFNTYGPSKLFTTDNQLAFVNHTNLSLTFNIKLKPNYDTNIINDIIADIKDYIEDINEISSLHMPNLITYITNTYQESLVFFEFVDMNGYGPGVQHLYSMEMPDAVITPEFLNIQALKDGTPDITLIMM